MKNPLLEHLDRLEEAVLEWLEASFFNSASPEAQRKLRQVGLTPSKPNAEMPEPYRLWRACQRHNSMWWSGGVSNQPYIMMHEFATCEIASNIFDEQIQNYREIINAHANRAGSS